MLRRFWFRTRRLIAAKVLHTDDTPHDIALGAGLATFVAFLPLIGLQTLIAVGLAALVKANKAICVPIVWITNPFTAIPIYTGCLLVGRLFIPASEASNETQVVAELERLQSFGIFDSESWSNLLGVLLGLSGALWLGCLVVGTGSALVMYGLARWGVVAYRERRRQRILDRELRRPNRKISHAIRRTEP